MTHATRSSMTCFVSGFVVKSRTIWPPLSTILEMNVGSIRLP